MDSAMIAIRLVGVFIAFGLLSSLEAQVVDARDNMILLLNPPRPLTKPKAMDPGDSFALLFSIFQVSTELDSAKAEGLGLDHPRIKALQAKLTSMQNQLQEDPAKTNSQATSPTVLDRIAQLETRQLEKEEILSREIATLKAEVAKLKEELEKARK